MNKNNNTTEETRAIVEQFYKRRSLNDIDGVIDLIADDIKWEIPGDKDLAPWLGNRSSKEEIREFFSLQKQHLESLIFDTNQLVVEGENAVAIGYLSSRMLKTDKVFNSHFMTHFIVKNKQITHYFFSEDSLELVKVLTEDERKIGEQKLKDSLAIDLVKLYFEKTDNRETDVNTLFSEDVEIYYPKFGEAKGRSEINRFIAWTRGFIETLTHEISDFFYIISENRVIVEGTESGILKNGKAFSKTRFCSVFTIKNNLISRMYIYVDPDFAGEDAERFGY